MPQASQASMFQPEGGQHGGVLDAGIVAAAEDRGGMLGAPPAVGHIDDGHVERAEDAQYGGQGLHLRAGGKAAQQQVADVDEPENEGGGQAGVPGPPDAPGAASPERPGNQHDGAEDDADFGAGQRPGIGRSARGQDGCGGS